MLALSTPDIAELIVDGLQLRPLLQRQVGAAPGSRPEVGRPLRRHRPPQRDHPQGHVKLPGLSASKRISLKAVRSCARVMHDTTLAWCCHSLDG